MFAWETGARASECLALEKRHVDFENERVVFPQSEEKMERAPRVVYLTAATLEIVRRRCVTATGKVFRNSNGRPWTTDAVKYAFEQIQIRMGKEAMRERGLTIPEEEVVELTAHLKQRWMEQDRPAKTDRQYREMARFRLWNKHAVRYAPKYCLTVIRHSWCHRALKRGLDALTVSQLMGHADVTMVAKVYSHLSHAPTSCDPPCVGLPRQIEVSQRLPAGRFRNNNSLFRLRMPTVGEEFRDVQDRDPNRSSDAVMRQSPRADQLIGRSHRDRETSGRLTHGEHLFVRRSLCGRDGIGGHGLSHRGEA